MLMLSLSTDTLFVHAIRRLSLFGSFALGYLTYQFPFVFINLQKSSVIMIQILAIWGCMPEITNGCMDMTNASSTYLSIAVGAVVGALISWLVFYLQKKSTNKQEENLQRLNELNESHDRILKLIQQFQKHQERMLDQILSMDKKIDSSIERKKDVK
jgi:type II secretory pathway component PulF